jgi:DNA-directed RNA polymerase specialized sigma24 family protein
MDQPISIYESLRRQLSTRQPVDAVFNGFLDTLDGLPADARVAFLMSEIFEAGIDEVALLLRRDPDACRALLHEARSCIQAARAPGARPRHEDLP